MGARFTCDSLENAQISTCGMFSCFWLSGTMCRWNGRGDLERMPCLEIQSIFGENICGWLSFRWSTGKIACFSFRWLTSNRLTVKMNFECDDCMRVVHVFSWCPLMVLDCVYVTHLVCIVGSQKCYLCRRVRVGRRCVGGIWCCGVRDSIVWLTVNWYSCDGSQDGPFSTNFSSFSAENSLFGYVEPRLFDSRNFKVKKDQGKCWHSAIVEPLTTSSSIKNP